MFKVKITDPDNILKQLKGLPEKLELVKYSIGSTIAENIKRDVKSLIPSGAGWLSLYKNSIEFYYEKGEWVVGGETDGGDIKNFDADLTLVSFVASDPATNILVNYNDWPIDLIPAIQKAYSGRIVIKSSSQAQVDLRRKSILRQLPKIRQLLRDAGFIVDTLGVPTINGRLTADLRAFSRQLEEGRGLLPFPSVPHWRPAVANVSSSLKDIIASTKSKFKAILSGDYQIVNKPMSSEMRSTISRFAKRKVQF
jgi:hypothetical protein